MRCIAVIEAQRPGLDSVILWERADTELVAFGYLNGQIEMTRPLAAHTIDEAVTEIQENFQINTGQLSRVTNWTEQAIHAQPLHPPRRPRQRW